MLCCAPEGRELDTLATWMTGSFSSAQQATADSAFFDIRLEMARTWSGQRDGYWLYVEQAAAESLEQPYRQRVYHLTDGRDGSVRSEVYEIPDPLRFAGKWRSPAPLDGLSPDSLVRRDGCAVVLRRQPDSTFSGSTVGTECVSSLRGAAYATSEVSVRPDRLESWDRGFSATGAQVWGATEGPYVFRRMDSEEGLPHDWIAPGDTTIAGANRLLLDLRDHIIRAVADAKFTRPGFPKPCSVEARPDPERPGGATLHCVHQAGTVDTASGILFDADGHFMQLAVLSFPDSRLYLAEIFLVQGRLPPRGWRDERYAAPRVALHEPFLDPTWYPTIWSALRTGIEGTGAQLAPDA
jgi:hypothetical protein